MSGSPHEGATRKGTTPPEIRPDFVSAPQVPSLRSQYVIGLLGICLVFVPILEALGTHINLGLPLRIGGIFTVALAVAAAVQIEEWVMCAQVALGLGLFGLGCFGPTDAIVDIFFCCVFGFLIAFFAGMQAENFKAARALFTTKKVSLDTNAPATPQKSKLADEFVSFLKIVLAWVSRQNQQW